MTGLARLVATLLGVGFVRPAPGTWGSLVALPWAWLLHVLGGFPLLALGTLAAFAAGWWATHVLTRDAANKDPSEIVVDELAGQWVALLPLSYAAWAHQIDILAMWPGWIAAFVLFRLFDILKPGPVGWADRRGGALSVMLDDVIAGLFAAMGVVALAALYHGVLT
jgi:phosphatidylglycerophosphatase A